MLAIALLSPELLTLPTLILTAISGGITLLSASLLLEAIAACLPSSNPSSKAETDSTVAILVPAHNEASGIAETLETLTPQLRESDRLLVVADNCDDETAAMSHAAGAEVIERVDAERRGKGYALDFGMQALAENPPDVVIVVDADCSVAPGAIALLRNQAITLNRPVQARYLLETPPDPSPKAAVSAFAFRVKNWLRPQGLYSLGLPNLLTGTGMAFPWDVLNSIDLASGDLVEDMKLAIDLAAAGYPPSFCAEAHVLGRLPDSDKAATNQRTRWEHGHLQSLLTYCPRLLVQSLLQFRPKLFALAIEVGIPPLSLFAMVAIAVFALTGVAGLLFSLWTPAIVASIALGCLVLAVSIAWVKVGREVISLTRLLSIPLYLLWKIPLYFKFLVRPQQEWVRTERSGESSPEPEN